MPVTPAAGRGVGEWTRREAWAWGEARLRWSGLPPEEARLEAEVLLRHAASVSREELFLRPDSPLPVELAEAFVALIARREEGRPTAYLVGRREFYGLEIQVDDRVLIPRPETEVLVEVVLRALREVPAPLVVEIGTGSGAVAIALARNLPHGHVVATDWSQAALEVARANGRRHGVAGRVTWVAGDALAPLRGMGLEGTAHALCANPPYIPTPEVVRLPREVRDHEPREALDGGPDGLAVHRRIIAGCARYLHPGGLLALEVGTSLQAGEVVSWIRHTGSFEGIEVVPDYGGAERVVVARRRSGDADSRH